MKFYGQGHIGNMRGQHFSRIGNICTANEITTDNCNCNTDKVHPDRNTSDAIGVGVKTKTCYGWSECNGIPMSVDLDYFCLPNKDKHARQAYLLMCTSHYVNMD